MSLPQPPLDTIDWEVWSEFAERFARHAARTRAPKDLEHESFLQEIADRLHVFDKVQGSPELCVAFGFLDNTDQYLYYRTNSPRLWNLFQREGSYRYEWHRWPVAETFDHTTEPPRVGTPSDFPGLIEHAPNLAWRFFYSLGTTRLLGMAESRQHQFQEAWNAEFFPNTLLGCFVGEMSERKLRLFAVACCRRLWDNLVEPRSQKAVIAAEKFVDGKRSPEELKKAAAEAAKARHQIRSRHNFREDSFPRHKDFVRGFRELYAAHAAQLTASQSRTFRVCSQVCLAEGNSDDSLETYRDLLADVVRNPFAEPIELGLWATNSTVSKLAQAIYEKGRFADVPILADALEEAGCDDEEILGHCRNGKPHVRGCWVIDSLLGKE